MYEETGSNICQSFLNIAICEKISYSKGVRKSSHLKKGENMAGKNTDVCLDKNQGERKKYISEVFDIDEQIRKYGNKIMLIAGVGSGKSTWVKEVLSQKGNETRPDADNRIVTTKNDFRIPNSSQFLLHRR